MLPDRYADDLGLSSGINAGIAEAHERGIVTSASLMMRQSGAEDGADLARRHPELAIGLHLDLGQRDYETATPAAAGDRLRLDDRAAVEAECRAQLDAFRDLLGRDPTHLDSHQHVHLVEPLAAAAARLAAELGIPLRAASRIRYEGRFYGRSEEGEPRPERITAECLVELIGSLSPGWTELGCHPGRAAEGLSSYGAEREREIEALCDARVRAAIEEGGVRLRSFAQCD
ncbi:MAG TPA: ChbG/HpnK family deacetylase [Solirubrobacterales bacterium]|nr:ChbG/HpnK family deacetylase [Solirubrobacterales bacterium]